jgi:hypothetical protein
MRADEGEFLDRINTINMIFKESMPGEIDPWSAHVPHVPPV